MTSRLIAKDLELSLLAHNMKLMHCKVTLLTHSALDHIKMHSDTIIFLIRFSKKILNYVPKEKHFLQKMSPHLSQLDVVIAHRNYFGRNNLWILKLATYTKIEDYSSGVNWKLFRLERIAKCSYFILSTQNIKFYWFVMKIKKLTC